MIFTYVKNSIEVVLLAIFFLLFLFMAKKRPRKKLGLVFFIVTIFCFSALGILTWEC